MSSSLLSELAAQLNGEWLIDESVSKNTGDLLTYFGMPWVVAQAVLLSPTPPLIFELNIDSTLSVTYPGLFPLKNEYILGKASKHKSIWSAQDCECHLGKDEEGSDAVVISVPQDPKLGVMTMTHSVRSGRHCVLITVVLDGKEMVRIPRVYDRKK